VLVLAHGAHAASRAPAALAEFPRLAEAERPDRHAPLAQAAGQVGRERVLVGGQAARVGDQEAHLAAGPAGLEAGAVAAQQAFRLGRLGGGHRDPQRPLQGRQPACGRLGRRNLAGPGGGLGPGRGDGLGVRAEDGVAQQPLGAVGEGPEVGSKENSTARPSPTGSSITAAVPPSSSSPAANPETKKSGLAAGG